MKSDQIILEPVLTEKTNQMRETGKYVFVVDKRANKYQVMQAIRELFSVHPTSCNIMLVKGKPKRSRTQAGYTATWKKAIVTLQKGEKITIFEGA
jgi:large subunit ribosomal protein L23